MMSFAYTVINPVYVVSDLEVEYTEETGKLYYFKYSLSDGSGFIPVATTRPETILGDSAVCVHPNDERYASMVGKTVRVPFVDRDIPG
jgi:valyl-tRNA synthetase